MNSTTQTKPQPQYPPMVKAMLDFAGRLAKSSDPAIASAAVEFRENIKSLSKPKN